MGFDHTAFLHWTKETAKREVQQVLKTNDSLSSSTSMILCTHGQWKSGLSPALRFKSPAHPVDEGQCCYCFNLLITIAKTNPHINHYNISAFVLVHSLAVG